MTQSAHTGPGTVWIDDLTRENRPTVAPFWALEGRRRGLAFATSDLFGPRDSSVVGQSASLVRHLRRPSTGCHWA